MRKRAALFGSCPLPFEHARREAQQMRRPRTIGFNAYSTLIRKTSVDRTNISACLIGPSTLGPNGHPPVGLLLPIIDRHGRRRWLTGLRLPCSRLRRGLTGGQRFFPVHQIRIFRIISPLLGGRGGRRLHIWTVFQKPSVVENRVESGHPC
jgi:hypothetical protein